MMRKLFYAMGVLAMWVFPALSDQIGEVDTAWNLLGPNHRIIVEAFDDPKISGVSCFVSRPVTGGVMGGLGLATERSQSSIACRQTGAINISNIMNMPAGEKVFSTSTSLLFKELQVARFWDEHRKTIIYLVYSTYLIDGSPSNSISAVVVRPW